MTIREEKQRRRRVRNARGVGRWPTSVRECEVLTSGFVHYEALLTLLAATGDCPAPRWETSNARDLGIHDYLIRLEIECSMFTARFVSIDYSVITWGTHTQAVKYAVVVFRPVNIRKICINSEISSINHSSYYYYCYYQEAVSTSLT